MLRSELALVFRRRRNQALLAVLFLVPVAIAIGVKVAGPGRPGAGPAFLSQVTDNGIFVALSGLTVVLPFFLPLAAAVVAGDAIAGEANFGTLRYLLTRPVGRTRLLLVKFVAVAAFCIAAALAVLVGGVLSGAALFPVGALTTLSGVPISYADGLGRAALAAGVVGLSMIGVAGVGMLLSTLTEVPVGAMAGTIVITLVIEIAAGLPQLRAIHSYLYSRHWDAFADLYRVPVHLGAIGSDLLLQAVWALAALLAAWARFTTSDVLA
jgi:ABC-2 type transport system permease protein